MRRTGWERADWARQVARLSPRHRAAVVRRDLAGDLLLWGAVLYPDVVRSEYSALHHEIAGWADALGPAAGRRSSPRRVVCGPRAGAKTSLMRMLHVRALVTGLEPYSVLIGPESTYCEQEAIALRGLLDATDRPLLRLLYGGVEVSGNLSELDVATGRGVRAHVSLRGLTGTIRGLNRGGQRPSLVILDDVEKPEDAESPSRRRRLRARLASDVGNLGPPEGGMAAIYGATDLGDGSLPQHAEQELGWERTTVPAVLAWPAGLPDGVDLPGSRWEECRRIYLDRTRDDRRGDARAFFAAHRAEMARGARVLHPVYQPLWTLVERLWDVGRVEFFRDYQQRPLSGDAAVFQVSHIRRAVVTGDTVRLHDGHQLDLRGCDVSIWMDPRNSAHVDRNDFTGIAVVAVDRRTGYGVVLDHVSVRESPGASVERLWETWERWSHLSPSVGCESNQGGAAIADAIESERRRRILAARPHSMRCDLIHTTGAKTPRLASLALPLETGRLHLAADLDADVRPGDPARMRLDDQLAGFPRAAVHDDGLDAVERAWVRAVAMADGAGVSVDVVGALADLLRGR